KTVGAAGYSEAIPENRSSVCPSRFFRLACCPVPDPQFVGNDYRQSPMMNIDRASGTRGHGLLSRSPSASSRIVAPGNEAAIFEGQGGGVKAQTSNLEAAPSATSFWSVTPNGGIGWTDEREAPPFLALDGAAR